MLELALRYEKSEHKRATLYLEIANHLKDSGQLDMAFKVSTTFDSEWFVTESPKFTISLEL